jgi:hypothetical protein
VGLPDPARSDRAVELVALFELSDASDVVPQMTHRLELLQAIAGPTRPSARASVRRSRPSSRSADGSFSSSAPAGQVGRSTTRRSAPTSCLWSWRAQAPF